jgi:hypothetical protein
MFIEDQCAWQGLPYQEEQESFKIHAVPDAVSMRSAVPLEGCSGVWYMHTTANPVPAHAAFPEYLVSIGEILP